jgi:transcription initiation factor TFIID subunit 13
MKRKRIFQKELKSLMFGFGDVSNSLPESIDLMDELLELFVADLCTTAYKKSQTRYCSAHFIIDYF